MRVKCEACAGMGWVDLSERWGGVECGECHGAGEVSDGSCRCGAMVLTTSGDPCPFCGTYPGEDQEDEHAG